jgi:hypothetical protein
MVALLLSMTSTVEPDFPFNAFFTLSKLAKDFNSWVLGDEDDEGEV